MAKREKKLHVCSHSLDLCIKEDMLRVDVHSTPQHYVMVHKKYEDQLPAQWTVLGPAKPLRKPRKKKSAD